MDGAVGSRFQGWKAALNSVGVVEEQITSARFLALAANLDIAYEDAMEIYRKLSAGGSGVVSTAQLGSGLDFGLHEFALRVWLALDAGTALADVAKRLQAAAFEGELSLKSFREVCDRHSEEPPGPTSSQGVGNFRLAPSSKRIPSLKCQPSLTEQEIEAAYQAFKAKYGSVSLGAIRAELNSNTAFTDVLALDARPLLCPLTQFKHVESLSSKDRSTASIGETMVVRYRVPRELQSQLRENSFISLVPSNMVWMPGGGGCWMLGRQTVTEMTGPKFGLNRNGDGVLRVQVWPGVTTLEQGSADLRIFSSPDGMSIGKQVGSSARFQLRPPAPSRVMRFGGLSAVWVAAGSRRPRWRRAPCGCCGRRPTRPWGASSSSATWCAASRSGWTSSRRRFTRSRPCGPTCGRRSRSSRRIGWRACCPASDTASRRGLSPSKLGLESRATGARRVQDTAEQGCHEAVDAPDAGANAAGGPGAREPGLTGPGGDDAATARSAAAQPRDPGGARPGRLLHAALGRA